MSQKKLLVIGYVWPEPKSSAAGARMMQLLDFFLTESFSITFATTASKTDFMVDLPSRGIATEKIELNNESFDIFLKKIDPEIVIFDRFMMEEQFGWRVAEVCPEAIKILDTEDLHFYRKARQEAVKAGAELSPALLFSNIAKREIASIYRCDLSLIISEAEMQLLQSTFKVPEEILFYLPSAPTLVVTVGVPTRIASLNFPLMPAPNRSGASKTLALLISAFADPARPCTRKFSFSLCC